MYIPALNEIRRQASGHKPKYPNESDNLKYMVLFPEDYTIRKGATSARRGERAVIPFNMRDGTLIVEGKGNPKWNYSAPHGAGRVMSRREAKRQFSQDEANAAMEGITAIKIPIDESPMSYKDSHLIEDAIEPTATVIDRLKPILNVKA